METVFLTFEVASFEQAEVRGKLEKQTKHETDVLAAQRKKEAQEAKAKADKDEEAAQIASAKAKSDYLREVVPHATHWSHVCGFVDFRPHQRVSFL